MTTDDELIEAMAEATHDREEYWDVAVIRATAALRIARPVIEMALLKRLVKDGTQLAEECSIQRLTGIGSAVVLELKAATRTAPDRAARGDG